GLAAADGECVEGAVAERTLLHREFLFVWIGVGAEGSGCVYEFDGAVGFLFCQWIPLRVLEWKSGQFRSGDSSDGAEYYAVDQCERAVVADVSAHSGEL